MKKNNENWCMDFSNNEIRRWLIDAMIAVADVKCIVNDKYVSYDCEDDFEYITFDGTRQEFYISLIKSHTSLFIHNEEIMFIDDEEKKYYTISDVESCIVYEGNLIDKTHKQILELILKFIKLFHHSTNMQVTKEKLSVGNENSYTKYKYIINISNPNISCDKYE